MYDLGKAGIPGKMSSVHQVNPDVVRGTQRKRPITNLWELLEAKILLTKNSSQYKLCKPHIPIGHENTRKI